MKTKRNSAELLALFEGSLPSKRKKNLLSAMNEDQALRRRMMSHLAFENMMKTSTLAVSVEEAKDSHLDEATLGDFLENRLTPEASERVKLHLRTCMECFVKMAKLQRKIAEKESVQLVPVPAHFVEKARLLVSLPAADEIKVKRFVQPVVKGVWQFIVTGTTKIVSDLAADFARIFEKGKRWLEEHPLWGYTSAGLAVATVILFLLLLPKPAIENLPGSNQLTISDSDALGFVTEPEVRAYKGMTVNLSEDSENLVFRWAEIPEALFYEITLIEGGKRQKLPFTGVMEGTSFSLPKQEVRLKVKYLWELSGALKDGRVFAAQAEFICRK